MLLSLVAGDRIGRLTIERVLGRGGMGTVYAAYDPELDRRVAVKALRPDKARGPEHEARFLREARSLSRLEHPNICRIFDLIIEGENQYLVLELIEGQTLSEILLTSSDSGSLRTDAEKLEIAFGIASALEAAHRSQIIHRDLKPSNVMVTAQGVVKVLDFGLSRSWEGQSDLLGSWLETQVGPRGGIQKEPGATRTAGPETMTMMPPEDEDEDEDGATPPDRNEEALLRTRRGAVLGTPAFMSPEQARGDRVGASTDLYSFGLVLRFLFTGEDPLTSGLSGPQVLERPADAPISSTDPKGLRADLSELIAELLEQEPADRPTAHQTCLALERALDRTARWIRQGAAAALALLFVLSGVIYVLNINRERRVAVEARNQALKAQEGLQSVVDYLVDVLGGASPGELPKEMTAAQFLSRAVDQFEQAPPSDPAVAARVLLTLASVHTSAGLVDESLKLLEKAGELTIPEDEHLIHLDLLAVQSRTAQAAGASKEAERFAREAIAYFEKPGRDLAGEEFENRRMIGWIELAESLTQQERYDEAVAALETTFVAPELTPLQAWSPTRQLGVLLSQAEQHDRSGPLLEKAVDLATVGFGENHMATAASIESLAIDRMMVYEYEEGERLLTRTRKIYQALEADESLPYANLSCNLSNLYDLLDRYQEALETALECRSLVRSLKAGPFFEGWSSQILAAAHEGLGDLAEAEELYRESLQIFRELNEDHPRVPGALKLLAGNLILQHRFDEARRFLDEAIRRRTALHGERDFRMSSYHSQQSQLEWLTENSLEAQRAQERMLISALATPESALPDVVDTIEDHLVFLDEQGLTAEGAAVRVALEQLSRPE